MVEEIVKHKKKKQAADTKLNPVNTGCDVALVIGHLWE